MNIVMILFVEKSALISVCMYEMINSFSAKGNIELFANNADSGESARNELSHLKSALFGCEL